MQRLCGPPVNGRHSWPSPPGSLGRLGDLSSQLAGITGKIQNSVSRQHLLVFAADNGVVAEGVSSKNKNRYEWQPKNGCGYVLRNGTYKSLSRIITNSCIWMETRRPMWE